MFAPLLRVHRSVPNTKRLLWIYDAGPLLRIERQRSCDCREGGGSSAREAVLAGHAPERPSRVESGRLVIGHTGEAARRLCATSLLCKVGSSYSEEPGVEIL
jgi:hypothetical protein